MPITITGSREAEAYNVTCLSCKGNEGKPPYFLAGGNSIDRLLNARKEALDHIKAVQSIAARRRISIPECEVEISGYNIDHIALP